MIDFYNISFFLSDYLGQSKPFKNMYPVEDITVYIELSSYIFQIFSYIAFLESFLIKKK